MGQSRVLPMFADESVTYAEQSLQQQGVELLTNQFVKAVGPGTLQLSHSKSQAKSTVDFGVLVWATGIAPRPLVKSLISSIGPEAGQTRRHALTVDQWLRVQGCKNVFAVGDCA